MGKNVYSEQNTLIYHTMCIKQTFTASYTHIIYYNFIPSVRWYLKGKDDNVLLEYACSLYTVLCYFGVY